MAVKRRATSTASFAVYARHAAAHRSIHPCHLRHNHHRNRQNKRSETGPVGFGSNGSTERPNRGLNRQPARQSSYGVASTRRRRGGTAPQSRVSPRASKLLLSGSVFIGIKPGMSAASQSMPSWRALSNIGDGRALNISIVVVASTRAPRLLERLSPCARRGIGDSSLSAAASTT